MIAVFILLGTVMLCFFIFSLYKFRSLKKWIYIVLFINFIIYSFLIYMVLNEGGLKFIQQRFLDSNTKIEKAYAEKISKRIVNVIPIKDRVLLDAPIINQFPELPRGCEVTSLAMLLQYKGIQTDKMELAEKVKKDSTPLKKENGMIYWGSPNNGFIGDMYSYSNPGYGVYHNPIKELAEKFLPGQIVDLTGKDFEELKIFLSQDIPVWIIINTTYKKLPDNLFETWQTPDGELKITYKEHSVLITGYDEQNIYFNDPISGEKNKKVIKEDFIEAWKQMGNQAVTYLPE
ncbi:C39 family peptidase [Niallia oryzisoli]|uniref:C39 family peptidase n=1 Tax=Niallia oryzisoli TaxID=1737571 RepID=UPI003735E19E